MAELTDISVDVECGFFDAVNNDRLYSAEDMNHVFQRIVSDGVFANSDGTPSTDLEVEASNDQLENLKIIVKAGEGIFGGRWFKNSSNVTLMVMNNSSGLDRIDSVIANVDNRQSVRSGRLIVRKGTPSNDAEPPALVNSGGVTEYRLANIYVPYLSDEIHDYDIVDLRGSNSCPWVTGLINQIGASITTLYQAIKLLDRRLYFNWDAGVDENIFSKPITAKKTFQSGMVSVSTTANAVSSYDVVFDVAFDVKPNVFVTAGSSGAFTSVKEATVSNVSKTGFTINIYRTDTITTGVYWFAHCNV